MQESDFKSMSVLVLWAAWAGTPINVLLYYKGTLSGITPAGQTFSLASVIIASRAPIFLKSFIIPKSNH